MTSARAADLVRRWGELFRKDDLASQIVAGLKDQADVIWRGAFELLQQESPEYRNSVDEHFTQELKGHCNALLATIVAIAGRQTGKPEAKIFDFVRTHAVWRARHHVPLIASLHAYRIAHRTYWSITRQALLQHAEQKVALRSLSTLSDFWIEFFDYVGAVLAEAHATEEGVTVARSTRTYGSVVDQLLSGRQPNGSDAERLLALCGITNGAPLAVVVVRPLSTSGTHMDIDANSRSLVRLVEEALPSPRFGKVIDVRDGDVVAIVSCGSSTARSAAKALRKAGFGRPANGLGGRAGISPDVGDIVQLPQALDDARLALEFARAARPLVCFGDIELPEFLIQRADRAAFRLLPQWVYEFAAKDDAASRDLLRTIRCFAAFNFNVKQTARELKVHTNTVYFRLNRIKKVTGIDPRTFYGTSFLLTALRMIETKPGAGSVA